MGGEASLKSWMMHEKKEEVMKRIVGIKEINAGDAFWGIIEGMYAKRHSIYRHKHIC